MKYDKILKNGIFDENPTFVQVIGMCPVLAITTTAVNGVGMGLSTMAVLVFSNLFVSLIRHFVPDQIRIPAYVVVIASFVTIVEFLLKAYLPALNNSLGLFIPLIVVNCIILARAETFAAKNPPVKSLLDGIGMGLGFTAALVIIGAFRELLGNGTILTDTAFEIILPQSFPRTLLMILPPGAFITLGLLMALFNNIKIIFAGKNQEGA
ncbi:MAG: electron transport complex subunit E [Defluviitaleaceae bacterium]|nr:electron transport complex subunit E [Defluviitaleaceae bacterium]MCL2837032.1 electron transport complex subunit E [Defluviitaleaceae bacterium]